MPQRDGWCALKLLPPHPALEVCLASCQSWGWELPAASHHLQVAPPPSLMVGLVFVASVLISTPQPSSVPAAQRTSLEAEKPTMRTEESLGGR